MGQVYACEHVSVGRKVAVKVLQPWLAQHPVGERLRTEARAASAAGHPNIVDVFDAGILDDGRPYIAMEFLDGQTLLDFIEDSPEMSTRVAAALAAQVARALHAAHQAGIIHRDLKPENVMLIERDRRKIVKVVDFGIAFDLGESKRMTREGLSVGTPQYMAPEQVFGAAGTPAFDIYALGVLLFEMCTGEPPFDGLKTVDILEAKASSVAPRLDARRPDAPAWLADLIAECLQHDPAARPQTAREVAERLERGGVDESTRVVQAPQPAVVSPTRRSWVVVGLGVCVGLGIAAWSMRPKMQTMLPGLVRVPVVVVPPTAEPDPVVPEPVPMPSVEPAPEPEPEPEAKPKPRPPAELPAVAADPKPVEPAVRCDGVVERARSSRDKHLWGPVLEEVAKKPCWSGKKAERLELRVHALKELGRFEACATAAKGSTDAEVQSWGRLCEKRAGS